MATSAAARIGRRKRAGCRRSSYTWFMTAPRSDAAVDDHRNRLTASEAEGGDPAPAVVLLERRKQRGEHPCATCPDRVPERDCAAVHVDTRRVEAERPDRGKRDHRECLVDLPQVDIGDCEPSARERAACRV